MLTETERDASARASEWTRRAMESIRYARRALDEGDIGHLAGDELAEAYELLRTAQTFMPAHR